ncbi:class I SAM-dependent methyltransferase [Neisseria sp. Ec49-e6-T10]|uniref:class I SAM-dependent methyltransferase n=1 Tax=Neisseria sp. Ec49-e6-T10 TaxID=3140744 RepID=UPI003EBB6DDC
MLAQVMSHLSLPEPFEGADNTFWQEDHISKQLLAAHLDPDSEGASRKGVFIDASVNWISQIAPSSLFTQLIDLGCGPGLYSQRFAQKGYQVKGIDFSFRSIEYAKECAQKNKLSIIYEYQNYLSWQENNHYDLAVLIYCDYGALAQENRKILLNNIYQSLKIGGRFILDVFSIKKFQSFEENQNWTIQQEGGFWQEEPYIALSRSIYYPEYVTLEQTAVFFAEQYKVYNIWHQYFSKEHIVAEVKAAGFNVIGVYGDVAGVTNCEQSDTLALVLEK